MLSARKIKILISIKRFNNYISNYEVPYVFSLDGNQSKTNALHLRSVVFKSHEAKENRALSLRKQFAVAEAVLCARIVNTF